MFLLSWLALGGRAQGIEWRAAGRLRKKVSRGIVKGYCWLLVYIYTLHVYMIPARRNQQSLNFTTLLILSLFPYRTWDSARYTATTLEPRQRVLLVLKNYNDYLPDITNTNQHQPTAPLQHHHWQTCSPSPPSSPPPASSSQPPTPSNSPIRAAQSVPPTIKPLPLAASTSFLSPPSRSPKSH